MQIGPHLWRYCHVLRHDGMDYGQYLDQITYLLFLKMWNEGPRESGISGWSRLQEAPTGQILSVFDGLLATLGARDDSVGAIFGGARSEFSSGESLSRLVDMIDDIHWGALDRDVQADAFEYLLERAAAEGKKGAGQYFTPRSLMRTIVACVQPGGLPTDRLIADPAAGTGGFLVAAKEWADANASSATQLSYWGQELVQRPRRLALMNTFLHQFNSATIKLGDALAEPMPVRPDVVLANPPFGSNGARTPDRADFWFKTANKQANFLQHIVRALADGGRAAVIVPDNCLFGDIATGLLPGLAERADLHTILRLPEGTFSPYTSGTKTNVLFLTVGQPTVGTWIYDARTRSSPAKRSLETAELDEFVACFGSDPLNLSGRSELASASHRWRKFDIEELQRVNFEIDRLGWRAESVAEIAPDHLRPLKLARDDVRAAVRELDTLIDQLEAASEVG